MPYDLRPLQYIMAQQRPFGSFPIFMFESPSASELGTEAEESPLLAAACALSGHRFASFTPISSAEFKQQLEYVFRTWRVAKGQGAKIQFAIHISCHGNADGLQVGKDPVSWAWLARTLNTANTKTHHQFILTLSACGGESLGLAKQLAGKPGPLYVFSFASEVDWADAGLTWALLYRELPDVKVGDKSGVQEIVHRIRAHKLGDLRYHRRHGGAYRIYPPRSAQ